MSFLHDLSTGIGAIGGLVPGIGTGVAIAAGVAGKLAGAPDALALNPYPATWQLFEPEGLLWGVPLEEHEYEIPALFQLMQPGVVLGLQQAPQVAGQWLASTRRTWVGSGGVELWQPSGGAWKRITSAAMKPPVLKEILRIEQINVMLEGYAARRAKMLAGDSPVFHYLETRTWAQAEMEWWRRTAPSAASPMLSHVLPPGPQSLSAWRKTPAAAAARAEHEARLAAGLAAWEDSREHWRDWKQQLALQEQKAEQVSGVSQAFQDYVASAPPGLSVDELIDGFAQDFKPGTVQHNKQGIVQLVDGNAQALAAEDSKPSGALVAAGLVGVGLLLLLAEGK